MDAFPDCTAGVEIIWTVLVECPVLLRKAALGLISDLLLNPKLAQASHEWKHAKSSQTAPEALLTIWNEQQAMRGVGAHVTDVKQPLGADRFSDEKVGQAIAMGISSPRSMPPSARGHAHAPKTGMVGVPGSHASDSVTKTHTNVDGGVMTAANALDARTSNVPTPTLTSALTSDLRAAIYAVVHRLGYDESMPPPDLPVSLRAAWPLVVQYPTFAQGEVWHAIHKEFEQTRFRPTTPDGDMLNGRVQALQHKAENVQTSQGSEDAQAEESEKAYLKNFLATAAKADAGDQKKPKVAAAPVPRRKAVRARTHCRVCESPSWLVWPQ